MKNLLIIISRHFKGGNTHYSCVAFVNGQVVKDACVEYNYGYGRHGEITCYERLLELGITSCSSRYGVIDDDWNVSVITKDVKRKKDMITLSDLGG